MARTCQIRLAGTQLPLRLGAIDCVKLLQRGKEPDDVFRIGGMQYIEIECGHRSSMEHRAYAPDDDKVNAMPGQNG